VHVERADCPACGAAVARGISLCPVCKTSLNWTDGVPFVELGGGSHRRLVLLAVAILAVVSLALLVLMMVQ
jgi:prepilin signal peptidase PulO-like enzyme (type II secretory pathway)